MLSYEPRERSIVFATLEGHRIAPFRYERVDHQHYALALSQSPSSMPQSDNHTTVSDAGAVPPLVELAGGAPRRFILLADDGAPDTEGMADSLREPSREVDTARRLGYDPDCRR